MDTVSKQSYGVDLKMVLASAVLVVVILVTQSGCEKDPLKEDLLVSLKRDVAKGDVHAMHGMGVVYAEAIGVRRDDEKAVEWFRKAAEKGNGVSMHYIGLMYLEGRGVPQDSQQGLDWCHKAAEQGEAGAMHLISVVYANGERVPQDYKLAYAWLKAAAAFGLNLEDKDVILGSFLHKMPSNEWVEANRLSQEIVERIKSSQGAK